MILCEACSSKIYTGMVQKNLLELKLELGSLKRLMFLYILSLKERNGK